MAESGLFFLGQIVFILACVVAVWFMLRPKGEAESVQALALAVFFLPLYAAAGFTIVYGLTAVAMMPLEGIYEAAAARAALLNSFSVVLIAGSVWMVERAIQHSCRPRPEKAMATRKEEADMSGS